ncbi:MAG TPA: patatin-like phospholipase family protein [Xanthobacteraceae bacterium]|nr:patatin-like phospholipase family protein [Xanthobacteraceae bacterium]
MNIPVSTKQLLQSRAKRPRGRPPFDCIALLLQGGGALGAYQGGVYQALEEAELHPDWVAGISIGAINAALIAGNPPESRVEKLRSFWETITANPLGGWALQPPAGLTGDLARKWATHWFATTAVLCGAPGLFSPRTLHPLLLPSGTPDATSFYDTSSLKTTLERLVDFDRINAGEMRFSVGAVNVGTGNFVYFDNRTHLIRPEHVMASGALPPGFPAIEIEGEHYWDGGLVSNTPLQWVLESAQRQDTLAFQVDLWSARGAVPRTLGEVATRQKEIQYSSRTRASSDQFKKEQRLRNALADLFSKLPDRLRETPEFALLNPEAGRKVYNIVQLIYRSKQYEGESKDFEFSARSMEDHWAAGLNDTVRTLRQPEALDRPSSADGVSTFDLAAHGRM